MDRKTVRQHHGGGSSERGALDRNLFPRPRLRPAGIPDRPETLRTGEEQPVPRCGKECAGPARFGAEAAFVLGHHRRPDCKAREKRRHPQDAGALLPLQRDRRAQGGLRRDESNAGDGAFPDCGPLTGLGPGGRLRIRAPVGEGRGPGHGDPGLPAGKDVPREDHLHLPVPRGKDENRHRSGGARQSRRSLEAGHVRPHRSKPEGGQEDGYRAFRGGHPFGDPERRVRVEGRGPVRAQGGRTGPGRRRGNRPDSLRGPGGRERGGLLPVPARLGEQPASRRRSKNSRAPPRRRPPPGNRPGSPLPPPRNTRWKMGLR